MIKKLITGIVIACSIAASPIIMDHVRDIYLDQVVSRRAHPIKVDSYGTIGSSWQVEFKGTRLTVTNNHVCRVVEIMQRMKEAEPVLAEIRARYYKAKASGDKKKAKKILKEWLEAKEKFKKKSYPIEGKSLKVGNLNRKILYFSENHDICFLEPVGSGAFSLALTVHRGESITIIGHPRGIEQSISDGRIVGERITDFPWLEKAGKVKVLLSTAISYPGNSGSPVVNRYGQVVGILFAGTSISINNVNLVVPLSAIRAELESYVGRK